MSEYLILIYEHEQGYADATTPEVGQQAMKAHGTVSPSR